jgi:two-component system chemotaxis response regulator CheB
MFMLINAEAVKRDVLVIGASAGGVETLARLLSVLPPDLPAIVAIALHRSPVYSLSLATILGRHAPLPMIEPDAGQTLRPGTIYLAPPDRHMILEKGIVTLSRDPTEHRARPAIDVLFRSSAAAYGERVVGVVLTGIGPDGTAGLRAIKAAGGLSVVQDPSDALHPGMPSHAVRHGGVDLILRLTELPGAFLALANGEAVKV